jgi:hypothetical protein
MELLIDISHQESVVSKWNGRPLLITGKEKEWLSIYTQEDTNDVAQIAVPPENRAEHVVKFAERHLIGGRDQADDHRAHLAQNRSQNQAFEGGCFIHLSRLLESPDPRLFDAIPYIEILLLFDRGRRGLAFNRVDSFAF